MSESIFSRIRRQAKSVFDTILGRRNPAVVSALNAAQAAIILNDDDMLALAAKALIKQTGNPPNVIPPLLNAAERLGKSAKHRDLACELFATAALRSSDATRDAAFTRFLQFANENTHPGGSVEYLLEVGKTARHAGHHLPELPRSLLFWAESTSYKPKSAMILAQAISFTSDQDRSFLSGLVKKLHDKIESIPEEYQAEASLACLDLSPHLAFCADKALEKAPLIPEQEKRADFYYTFLEASDFYEHKGVLESGALNKQRQHALKGLLDNVGAHSDINKRVAYSGLALFVAASGHYPTELQKKTLSLFVQSVEALPDTYKQIEEYKHFAVRLPDNSEAQQKTAEGVVKKINSLPTAKAREVEWKALIMDLPTSNAATVYLQTMADRALRSSGNQLMSIQKASPPKHEGPKHPGNKGVGHQRRKDFL